MNKCKIDNIKFKIIEPIFKRSSVPVVFATDENFIPYLYVAIQSLVDNSSKENNYDIVILYENVSVYKQRHFKALESENISIRFYDMTQLMNQYKDTWYVHWNYSSAVYYRFFITKLFEKYNKVLYLDGDITINCDVAELYNTYLEDNYIAAIQELSMQHEKSPAYKYIPEKLKLKNKKYFNAGILLFNIKELCKFDFLNACVKTLKELKNPIFQDQDVLNKLCSGRIKYLDLKYNLAWNTINYYKSIEKYISEETNNRFIKAQADPKILHFCGAYKPWKQPWLPYSEYFWKYARKTPFYEELIFANIATSPIFRTTIKNTINRNYAQYLKYKFLKLITFGDKKLYYEEKAQKIKGVVDDCRKTLRA